MCARSIFSYSVRRVVLDVHDTTVLSCGLCCALVADIIVDRESSELCSDTCGLNPDGSVGEFSILFADRAYG